MNFGAPGEFGDADHGSLAGAHVIVPGDEPFALRRFAFIRIVDRHPICRPDFAAGDVRAPEPADRGEAFVGLDHGLAVCVMPGDDAPYFQSHGFLPFCDASGYSLGAPRACIFARGARRYRAVG
jgi:hypothetical protein